MCSPWIIAMLTVHVALLKFRCIEERTHLGLCAFESILGRGGGTGGQLSSSVFLSNASLCKSLVGALNLLACCGQSDEVCCFVHSRRGSVNGFDMV